MPNWPGGWANSARVRSLWLRRLPGISADRGSSARAGSRHQQGFVAQVAHGGTGSHLRIGHGAHWGCLDPVQHPLLHVCAGLRDLRRGDRLPLSLGRRLPPPGPVGVYRSLGLYRHPGGGPGLCLAQGRPRVELI